MSAWHHLVMFEQWIPTFLGWWLATLNTAASACCQHLRGAGQCLYLTVNNLQWPNRENPNCLMSLQHGLISVFFCRFFPPLRLLFSTHQSYSHLEPRSVDTRNIKKKICFLLPCKHSYTTLTCSCNTHTADMKKWDDASVQHTAPYCFLDVYPCWAFMHWSFDNDIIAATSSYDD